VLEKSFTKPPVALGTKCYEGPAVSRKNLKIAWVVSPKQSYEQEEGQFRMYIADIEYKQGVPALVNKKLVFDNKRLGFYCRPEAQSFRPESEEEIIFSAYDYNVSEVMGINIGTKKITNYTANDKFYEEPEGIFPDGKYTLMESDEQNPIGWEYVEIWKLKLDGSGERERLTYFSDYPGYKASNPVVSDDGKYMAFQLGRTGDYAGVGYGIFIYDFDAAKGKVKNN
jgi:Tol biopolymer transport system component